MLPAGFVTSLEATGMVVTLRLTATAYGAGVTQLLMPPDSWAA